VERLWFLHHREVATAFKDLQPRMPERGTEDFAVWQRDDTIQAAPDEEGIHADGLHLAR